ncbi:MAG: RNA polymerase sigma factor [Flavonifractor plautii]
MKKKPWKRLSQSDSEAVMRLVDEYQSSIKRIIVSVLKGQWPDAVDDILQDTYEEICRQLNLIEEAENRRAYVCKIAARLAIQAHRKLGRDLPLDEDVPAPEDLSFNLDTILPCDSISIR